MSESRTLPCVGTAFAFTGRTTHTLPESLMTLRTSFLLSLLIASLMALDVQAGYSQGYLHASGLSIVDGNNNPFLLRGMGLGGWLVPEGYMLGTSNFANSPTEIYNKVALVVGASNAEQFFSTYRTHFVQRKDIDSLAQWGFNSVRLPFHYAILSPAPGTYSESGFAIIDSLLSWCEADHVYLILDMHCAPGGQNTANISDYQGWPSLWEESTYQTWTADLWKFIAQRYANRAWIGGYDLLNETAFTFPNGNKPLRDLLVRITDSIRTVDHNHLLFMEGNWYATDFSGLTPAWDNNMAWSFHKYWNTNDLTAFQGFLQLRANTNVPLWLGESGENSNQWFADCLFYCEHLTIGWSWWTLKKIEGISCPFSVRRLPGFAALIDYWNGHGTQPTVDAALKALNDQAAMFDAENCTLHPDFLDALMRLPASNERKPFSRNLIPGPIFAANYDMGKQGIAYSDVDYQNTGSGSYNLGWAYRNDGVDIESSSDSSGNGFDVGWIAAGEFLAYTVEVQTAGMYRIHVRAASAGNGGKANIALDGVSLTPDVTIPGTGGWQTWRDIDFGSYVLPQGVHSFEFHETTGGYNLSLINFTLEPTSVSAKDQQPTQFALEENYPNPFNPETVIRGQWTGDSRVKLAVYDMLGREVEVLADGRYPAGQYTFTFNARGRASGVYHYRLIAGGSSATRTMLLLR